MQCWQSGRGHFCSWASSRPWAFCARGRKGGGRLGRQRLGFCSLSPPRSGLGKPSGACRGLGLGGLSKCLAVPACPSAGWREAALRTEATPTGPLPGRAASLALGVLTVETRTSARALLQLRSGGNGGRGPGWGSLRPGARPRPLRAAVRCLGPSFSLLWGPSDLAHGCLGACAPLLALLFPHGSCAAQDTSG